MSLANVISRFFIKNALRTTDEVLDILIVTYGFLLFSKTFFSLKLFSHLRIDKVKKQRKVAKSMLSF